MNLNTKPRRVPLLWILLPYCAGIGYARFLPTPPSAGIAVATFSLLGFAFWLASSKPPTALWHCIFALGTFALGSLRFIGFHDSQDDRSRALPREANLELRIENLFNATDPNTALGVARVVDFPIHQEALFESRIFFFLETANLPDYPQEGEVFSAIGVVRPLPGYEEGDRFDAYLRNLGIARTYKQGRFLERTEGAAGLTAFSNSARSLLSEALSQNAAPDSPYTGAYKGLMLGQKSELSSEQKDLFLANGTMHLFAISGLHIGVIALCFHHLLGLLRLKGGYKAIAALLCICLFVIVTGGSSSSWRATLMIACLYLVNATQRQPSPVNALALSALIYLLLLPQRLFQAGFQMSYLTVASILLLGLPLSQSLNQATPLFSHIPISAQTRVQRYVFLAKRWTLDTLGVSVAAFLISALLGMYYFQLLPSYGILINMIALPIASLAIVAGFLSLLFSPLLPIAPISELFNNAALVLIKLIHVGLAQASAFPAASIHTPPISAPLAAVAVISTLAMVGYAYCLPLGKSRYLWQSVSVAVPLAWIGLLHS